MCCTQTRAHSMQKTSPPFGPNLRSSCLSNGVENNKNSDIFNGVHRQIYPLLIGTSVSNSKLSTFT